MDRPEPAASYSISIRLRRTTVEYAYVNVPVDDRIVIPDPQGVGRIDGERMVLRAVEIGQQPEVVWYREEQRVEPHPLQKAPEPDESRYPL